MIVECFDEHGEPYNDEIPVNTLGLPLRRLRLESYFIAKGYVQLSLQDLRNLEATYGHQLYVALQLIDEITTQKHKEQMEKAQQKS